MIRAFLLTLMLGVSPALADDVALIIGNGSYANARGLWGADDLVDSADVFEAAGFQVFLGGDLNAEALRRLASDFAAEADGSGRIVIALAGHFVQSGTGAWFLSTDANAPGLISVGAEGLSMQVLYEIASRAPGRAVVMMGTEDRRIGLGAGLTPGTGTLPVPQGVAVIRGEADEIADFAGNSLLEPGRSLAAALADHSSLTSEGFVSDAMAFIDAGLDRPRPPAVEPTGPIFSGERAAWAEALALDTIAGYERFLRDYPLGANAALARAAVARMQSDPARGARETEDALRLSRDDRRTIQRNLSLMNFNTRGIDGVFGPASRRAIGDWQRANGQPPTTYLTRDQISRLEVQASRRASELEDEAAARKAELDRQDRAYWDETGARGTEAGLRAYLRRYPDGLYAEVAQERLKDFDSRLESEAAAADRADWDRARSQDTVAAYRRYLDVQPRGAFRDRASTRIDELTRTDQNAAAARIEQGLGLNPFTRNLVESRLDSLGLRPGRVDGVFDDNTRRAIRRYQSARNLPATGYLTQDTMVRLLADSILR